MPSTVVHAALAGLIAAALLRDYFDWRALLVVVGAVVFIDLDVFVGWWFVGTHRAAFHTLLFPGLLAGALLWDTRFRDRSTIRERFDSYGVTVGWVAVAAIVFAGIGPDLFFNGVNVLYPVHDQFYKLNGEVLLSDQRGFVQTFVDLSPPETGGESDAGEIAVGSTEEINDTYHTGVDPEPSNPGGETEQKDVERVFPLVQSGQQALVVLTSLFVVATRLVESRRS
jgi:hypothetical protein